jgi:hypothetical protein
VITNLKLQGTTSFVCVTLLTGLGYQDISMNLLHLLFCFHNNIGTKDNPLIWLGPTQRCPIGSSIKCFEGWHLDAFLITIVVWELCQWKILVSFWTIIQDPGAKHIFNDLIHLLGLTVSIRMISWALNKMGTKKLMYLFPEACNKDRAPVRDDGLRNAVIVDNVWNV